MGKISSGPTCRRGSAGEQRGNPPGQRGGLEVQRSRGGERQRGGATAGIHVAGRQAGMGDRKAGMDSDSLLGTAHGFDQGGT